MIKSFTATTREIDDPKLATKEILEQLNLDNKLLKNSIGIISCFSEFADTGTLKAVCDALPFECLGTTTCISSANNQTDQIILTITVLTSDDCEFKTSFIPLSGDFNECIKTKLSSDLKLRNDKPALFLSYFPLMNTFSGDMMVECIDKITGEIPLFGTTAVDHMMDYSTAQTLYNGNAYREAIILCAIYGNPKITYELASLDESKIRRQKAIITASNGNILIGINGKTAIEYLEEIGLTRAELATGLGILPLIVDHNNGTKPVARAVFALTPDGHAVCGGAMPVNATLSIGRVEANDVLSTTAVVLQPLIDKNSVILSYSCMARFLALGTNNSAEAEEISRIATDTNYSFACSGGEICPLPDSTGKLRNYYHNYTIVFCRIS